MAMIRKKDKVDQGKQLQVYVEPSSCKIKETKESDFCEWNTDVGIRFYEIIVNVMDLGGNIASTTATVVVVPNTKPEELEQEALENIIEMEPESYILETASMEWNFN